MVIDLAHVRGPLDEAPTALTGGRGSGAPDAATRGVGRGLGGVAMVEPVEQPTAPPAGGDAQAGGAPGEPVDS